MRAGRPFARGSRSFFAAHKILAQRRRPGKGEQQRSEERDRHGDGERAKEGPGYAGDGDERKKNDNRRDRGADQRNSHFPERALNGFDAPWPASRCSTIFSKTTIASSITRPTAAARPPSVMRL